MSKKIKAISIIGLSIAASTFICESAHAQLDWSGVNYYRNNQRPAGSNNNSNNRRDNNTVSPAEVARQQRLSEATAANNKGFDFYKNQDWANAVIAFQEAADKNPDDKVIQSNLAKAKFRLQVQKDEQLRAQQQEQQNKLAVQNMQQTVQTFTQSLNTSPSSGALDFDQRNSNTSSNGNGNGLGFISGASNTAQTKTTTSLEFGDPSVVDARNVSSGLPKSIDNAIADAYSKAPEGVSDRVRKGFQAIANHDWSVAKAWFGDALNHDPGNTGLKRLVELADYTGKRIQQIKAGAITGTSSSRSTIQLPEDSDIKYLFPDEKPSTATLSSNPGGKKMELPEASDIQFLFPGRQADQARDTNDHIFELALKMAKNDPELVKSSKGAVHTDPRNPVN